MTTRKRNMLLTGVAVVLLCMFTGSIFAQDGSLRLWKPYSPESFGGARRSNDGVYGAVDMLYWKIDGPRHLPNFSDIVSANSLNGDFQFGTKITFGNRRGHHGWVFAGYILPGSEVSIKSNGVYWEGETKREQVFTEILVPNGHDSSGDPIYETRKELLAVYDETYFKMNEGTVTLSSKTEINDIELMYSYRPHPFHWGEMELFAGVRYWDLNDKLGLSDKRNTTWYYARDPVTNGLTDDNTDTNDDLEFNSVDFTMEAIQSRSVRNRVTGPQIGFNLRRTNQRWTYGADFRFIAGMNMQGFNYQEKLVLGNNSDEAATTTDTSTGTVTSAAPTIEDQTDIRILTHFAETVNNIPTLVYHKNQTVFSPGVELNLSAKWQWTEAVGFHVGFNSTVFDNISRGSSLVHSSTPYQFDTGKTDGTGNPVMETRYNHKFSILDQGDAVMAYGVNFGVSIRR